MQFQFPTKKGVEHCTQSYIKFIWKYINSVESIVLDRFDVRISSSYSNSAECSYWCSISRKMKMVNQKREKSKTTKLLLLFFSNCKIFHHERTLAWVCVCVSVNLVDYMPACHSQPASQPVCRRQCVCACSFDSSVYLIVSAIVFVCV